MDWGEGGEAGDEREGGAGLVGRGAALFTRPHFLPSTTFISIILKFIA